MVVVDEIILSSECKVGGGAGLFGIFGGSNDFQCMGTGGSVGALDENIAGAVFGVAAFGHELTVDIEFNFRYTRRVGSGNTDFGIEIGSDQFVFCQAGYANGRRDGFGVGHDETDVLGAGGGIASARSRKSNGVNPVGSTIG